ncbi:cytochrome c [Hymenobacter sp. DG01]|uniref:c-type cytochrome n=1 Tax=Hymenobacter sp. DG01 TaxID=2584940 RepID=UPI002150F8B3|nr:cytochrome c [Hymenobacter sp. DG01]
MNKAWLEVVMPASLVLIFCTIMVFGFSMSGLLSQPEQVETALAGGLAKPTAEPAMPTQQPTGPDAAAIAAGDALFKGNCAQCHDVNEVVVGPALAGIAKRRPISWIIPWVKNSSKMVAKGDEYAVKIFNQYQKQEMPSFQLTDREIKAIVTYIEFQEQHIEHSIPTGAVAYR